MKEIRFKHETHSYFNEDGMEYISVSGLAKKLEVAKDWAEIKRKYAEKRGLTVAEVEADWKRKKDIGVEVGHYVHSIYENEMLELVPCGCLYEGKYKVQGIDERDGVKYSLQGKLKDNTAYPELIVSSDEHEVAGQADKVIVDNGKVYLYDYKTDKTMDFKAFSNDRVPPEMLRYPVDHIENCNGNMYNLKMSMYMFMILEANPHLQYGGIELNHVLLEREEDGTAKLVDGKPKIIGVQDIKLDYLSDEAESILEAYKYNEL